MYCRMTQAPAKTREIAQISTTVVYIQMGVAGLCKPVQGNFLKMPFQKETFDGAYAIEATCHANKVHGLSHAPLSCSANPFSVWQTARLVACPQRQAEASQRSPNMPLINGCSVPLQPDSASCHAHSHLCMSPLQLAALFKVHKTGQ